MSTIWLYVSSQLTTSYLDGKTNFFFKGKLRFAQKTCAVVCLQEEVVINENENYFEKETFLIH